MKSYRGQARFFALAFGLVGAIFAGCSTQPRPDLSAINAHWTGPTTRCLSQPYYDSQVLAVVDPPQGWRADPLKFNSTHSHQTWISPTGLTAYGVIHFEMPLPVNTDTALAVFMNHMRTTEGVATLISKSDDPNLPGIRYVAEGGIYKIRAYILVSGWEGWAVYAGTIKAHAEAADELDEAVRARDQTHVGKPLD